MTGVLEDVHRDFSFYRSDTDSAALRIEVYDQEAPRDGLPLLRAKLHSPRNSVYRDRDASYLDYSGRALAVRRSDEGSLRIYCRDRDLAHEIAYLAILSHVGQHLDSIRLHRVHALGVEAGGRAALILLPMGGGKTTLALALLKTDGIRLISEDSPLISRRGHVLPFPLRIGVRPGGAPADVPEKYIRTVERMEFGPKTLIDIEHYRDRIAGPCRAGLILLGERRLNVPSSVRPASRKAALAAFIRNSVVGLGLYQGVEFVLQTSAWELLGKAGLALSRLRNSASVIRRSQVYEFLMGPDIEQTQAVLIRFLQDFAARPR